jgi:ferredoxin-nitrite reductase
VWQNLLIPHIPDAFVETVKRNATRLGCFIEAQAANGGIIACTGNRGCKYAAADTKAHALGLFRALQGKFAELDQPVNVHFTGCSHSCAQHYCGDLGFIGAKLADGSEGYHVVLGGGMDHEQGIGREIFRGMRATEVNALVHKILATYTGQRTSGETFVQWSRRHSVGQLQEMLS